MTDEIVTEFSERLDYLACLLKGLAASNVTDIQLEQLRIVVLSLQEQYRTITEMEGSEQ